MEQVLYQRPREKLQANGVSALTLVELLQVVLSPGNAQLSAAQLARHIVPLIEAGDASYRKLVAIRGIGHAKACQILALIELQQRSFHE